MLTIESEEALRLATELAGLTGKSLSDAVLLSLRHQTERERGRKAKVDHLMELAAQIRAGLTEPISTYNTDFLYDDETGLPK